MNKADQERFDEYAQWGAEVKELTARAEAAEQALAAMTAERDEWRSKAQRDFGLQDSFLKKANEERDAALSVHRESLAREEALRGFVIHPDNCQANRKAWGACDCGLAELLALPRDSAALDALMMRCAAVVREACLYPTRVHPACGHAEPATIAALDLAAILRGLRP